MKLTVTNKDNGCATSTIKANDIVIQRFPTSIEQLNSELSIYPNPISQLLFIDSEMEILNVSVYSITGKHLKPFKPSNSNTNLDLTSAPVGTYIVLIDTKEGLYAKRILKQ
ncbi:MAG: T9SS type A sorting domain-containing protein [Bacteroidia bacterium]